MKRVLPLVLLAALGAVYLGYRHYLAMQPFEWAGTVEARAITVGSRTGGRVARILVPEGAHVTAGQPLVILEPGDLEAQLAIARAQVEQAKANLDKLAKTGHGSRAEEIAVAEARLAQSQATLEKAQLDADRAHRLLATGAIAKAEADTADTTLRAATAVRDAQQKVVEQLRAGAREDLRAAEAQVDAAKARVQQLDIMIDELTIRSPAAARVESLDLRPGDILAPNAPAATLLEDNQLYVRIYVPETQIGRVRVNQEVPVRVDSFPGRDFKGRVEHINAKGEYTPRNLQTADERADQVFAMRVALLEGRDVLRAGMAATIRVPK